MTDIIYPEKLTLDNLVPNADDRLAVKSFTKRQRKAMYDYCERIRLTADTKEMRSTAELFWQELRRDTLNGDVNKCGFDVSGKEAALLRNKVIPPSIDAKNS